MPPPKYLFGQPLSGLPLSQEALNKEIQDLTNDPNSDDTQLGWALLMKGALSLPDTPSMSAQIDLPPLGTALEGSYPGMMPLENVLSFGIPSTNEAKETTMEEELEGISRRRKSAPKTLPALKRPGVFRTGPVQNAAADLANTDQTTERHGDTRLRPWGNKRPWLGVERPAVGRGIDLTVDELEKIMAEATTQMGYGGDRGYFERLMKEASKQDMDFMLELEEILLDAYFNGKDGPYRGEFVENYLGLGNPEAGGYRRLSEPPRRSTADMIQIEEEAQEADARENDDSEEDEGNQKNQDNEAGESEGKYGDEYEYESAPSGQDQTNTNSEVDKFLEGILDEQGMAPGNWDSPYHIVRNENDILDLGSIFDNIKDRSNN
ncbi:hypothetical protein ABW19_dt0204756 [Dactylella cylindrospora]|nr:hypothetical protein ABW19_dt0204756 [Dactylella cylindrospora]